MIRPEDCRFCCGAPVPAEETAGDGIKTMEMILNLMFGRSSEDEYVSNGIQLMDGNLLCFDNSAREYQTLGIRIGHCPLCGRELKPEEKENEE